MRRVSPRVVAVLMAFAIAAGGAVLFAQDFFRQRSATSLYDNVEYDGRLTFVRLRYSGNFRRDPGWVHDYPTADIHMMKILSELSITPARTDGSNILTLDDPELCHYPIAYMSEPGFWVPSESEAAGLRNYLLKGGFIIFDDFRSREGHWYNLETQMRRVLPQHRFIQLDAKSPIFNSFFEITTLQHLTSYGGVMPTYWAIFENNDPGKRLMAIADVDGDIGEYWEYSATGLFPVDLSNEAYKFGMNYFIYGLTH
jgi:uncharacterized protein DUF4159